MQIGRDEVVAVCNARISRWNISGVSFGKHDVEVTGSQATMHVVTILSYGEEGSSRTSLIWDIIWVKRDGRWRILEVAEPRQGVEF